jgi:ssDNA thymidine ADP-ribosyltransferase, DarT
MAIPPRPRIYHITHVDNLADIAADGVIWSDAVMARRGGPAAAIGMSTIKQRRLRELLVKCHPETFAGEYVPFYFCPRSIMLYLIYMANHPELTYRGGQEPIVHLEADLIEAVAWADAQARRWAFSLSNAGARYAEFRCSLDDLGDVDWDAVSNRDFRSPEVKEGKQAEFLMYESFPLALVRRIGAYSEPVAERAATALADTPAGPPVAVRRDWYF